MSGHITALYHNLYDAGRAIEDLVASGIAPDEISLVTSEARSGIFEIEYAEAAPAPAIACGAIGGALGAMGAHLLSSQGGGDGILSAGPLLESLAGIGPAGTGLSGRLSTLGLPAREAKFYEYEIRRHDALMVGVAVLHHQTAIIQNILERHHATSVTLPA